MNSADSHRPVLPFLETMLTQSCNLSCHGCTNYSDLPHKGFVSWNQGRRSIENWLSRVDIPDFGLIGGEPLMHPRVEDWILGVREILPHAQIRFTTNGLLLREKFHVVKLMEEIGNCVFKIAVHVIDKELEDLITEIKQAYDWQPIEEFGVSRLTTGDRFRFQIKRPEIYWKTHRNHYEDMAPHHSRPHEAFAICCQQTCPLLHKGRIYKCSSNGLLDETLARVDYPNMDQWEQYLDQGLSPDCSDEDLAMFIGNFGKPHRVCGMCPSPQHLQSRLIHIENVSVKKYAISK